MNRRNNLIVFNESDRIDCITQLGSSHFSSTIDLIKVTTSAITDRELNFGQIKELVEESRRYGIDCYLGGGITEDRIRNGELDLYIEELHSLGIKVVELGNSDGDLANPDILGKIVEKLLSEFDRVLVEVGSKSQTNNFSRNYNIWGKSIDAAISAGASGIVLEGGMGRVGIYDKEYKIKTLLLMYLLKKLSENKYDKEIIVESIEGKSQEYIISLLGPDVKLGNICLRETSLDLVESTRNKNQLYDKGFLSEFFELIDIIFALCNKYDLSPNYFFFNSKYYDLDQDVQQHISLIRREVSNLSGKDSGIILPSDPVSFLKFLPSIF